MCVFKVYVVVRGVCMKPDSQLLDCQIAIIIINARSIERISQMVDGEFYISPKYTRNDSIKYSYDRVR